MFTALSRLADLDPARAFLTGVSVTKTFERFEALVGGVKLSRIVFKSPTSASGIMTWSSKLFEASRIDAGR